MLSSAKTPSVCLLPLSATPHATLLSRHLFEHIDASLSCCMPSPCTLHPQASQNPAGYLTGASEEELKIAKEKGLL